ncbi:LOW QUALITY PROTEIN: zinc finger protein ZPR1 [Geothlypis trichas]
MSALAATAAAAAPAGALFRPLSAEDGEQQPAEIESLCMNCVRNGVTRLLLTRIPFFKEIIVSSFSCPSCSWSNTEIQAAGRIQEQGVRYTLAVTSRQDMNREVVKTDCASARIPELDFEVPAFSQKGVLTTIEGIIDRAVAGLEQDQPARRATDKEVARKIDEFIGKLRQLKEVSSPSLCCALGEELVLCQAGGGGMSHLQERWEHPDLRLPAGCGELCCVRVMGLRGLTG